MPEARDSQVAWMVFAATRAGYDVTDAADALAFGADLASLREIRVEREERKRWGPRATLYLITLVAAGAMNAIFAWLS